MTNKLDFSRKLAIELPEHQSAFLLGPRKTGKTYYLRQKFPDSIYYDLLNTELYLGLLKKPSRLREELIVIDQKKANQLIIIDEIQLVPMLLNEVHWLIENTRLRFILCGSSARKLRKEHANMLGGRAWRFDLFPLTFSEIPDFDIIKALNRGLLPSHYTYPNFKKSISSYISTYLQEEIRAEGLERDLPSFSRFLDAVSFQIGELVNYTNIASDCGVKSRTVKEYYQILSDTFLGYYLYPFTKKSGRDSIISTPKFYFFDTGIAGALSKLQVFQLKGAGAGKIFENFLFTELLAYNSYNDLAADFSFWRTKSGLEIDFIINKGAVAIESKISENISKQDLKGLIAFNEEIPVDQMIIVCNESRRRNIKINETKEIKIYPWKIFLKELWEGEIF